MLAGRGEVEARRVLLARAQLLGGKVDARVRVRVRVRGGVVGVLLARRLLLG